MALLIKSLLTVETTINLEALKADAFYQNISVYEVVLWLLYKFKWNI